MNVSALISPLSAPPAAKQDSMSAPQGKSFDQVLSGAKRAAAPAPRQESQKPASPAKAVSADKAKTQNAEPPSDGAAKTDAVKTEAAPDDAKTADKESLTDASGMPQAMLMMELMTITPIAPQVVPASAGLPVEVDAEIDAAATAASLSTPFQAGVAIGATDKDTPVLVESTDSKHGDKPGARSTDQPLPGLFAKAIEQVTQSRMTDKPAAIATDALLNQAATPSAPIIQAAAQMAAPINVPTEKLAPPVGTPAWDQALGHKVIWMTQGGEQTASLTMNPPDLGPLKIVINVSNDQATVNFTAAQPEVRAALENALPRLREMMGESGIQLGQANVGSEQQSAGFHQSSDRRKSGLPMNTQDAEAKPQEIVMGRSRIGAVDTFA